MTFSRRARLPSPFNAIQGYYDFSLSSSPLTGALPRSRSSSKFSDASFDADVSFVVTVCRCSENFDEFSTSKKVL